MSTNILIVIPARGGSKGIPRKNLRVLAGKPLLYYSCRTTTASRYAPHVVVSSEDEEIQMAAGKFGVDVVQRDPALSGDAVTLDSVIHDAMVQAERKNGITYDLVITAQPTSPLLETATLDAAIEKMLAEPGIETLISVVDDRHLCWEEDENGKLIPAYEARLNRQYLPARYRETGSFFIARRAVVTPTSRFGSNVGVYPISARESVDVDTYADWALCEYYLSRRRVVFVTTGYPEIGLGHVYNLLAVAGGILEHELLFVVDQKSRLAYDTIASFNYPVLMAEGADLATFVNELRPDVIINDRLDTSKEYMEALKTRNVRLINFEDLGPGAALAHLVVNAMYPERAVLPNHYFGHRYFCLRSEFLLTESVVDVRPDVRQVLLTFGGVDPNNFTRRVLSIITPICRERGCRVKVILGRGYTGQESLAGFSNVQILSDVKDMSEQMLTADLAFTSAGRTTFETASLGLPTIVLCQNKREQSHFFAGANYGFRNLGLGTEVDDETIRAAFVELLEDHAQRRYMSELMLRQDIKAGHDHVLQLIKQTITNV